VNLEDADRATEYNMTRISTFVEEGMNARLEAVDGVFWVGDNVD
jgi:hypothetical protein